MKFREEEEMALNVFTMEGCKMATQVALPKGQTLEAQCNMITVYKENLSVPLHGFLQFREGRDHICLFIIVSPCSWHIVGT